MTPADAPLLRLAPRRLVAAVERAPDQRREGVILFVDVAGFSALADRLTEGKGAYGVDQLVRILNGTMRPVVTLAEAHGGEVVTFAGDAAAVGWFVPEAEEGRAPGGPRPALRELARLAAQCARTIQVAIREAGPVEGVQLQVRQALTAGELRLLQVGDAPRFAVVGGAPMVEVGELLKQVPAGEIVVAAGFPLDDAAGVRLLPPQAPLPDLDAYVRRALAALGPPAPADVALAYVHPSLRRRAEAVAAEWVSELRMVSSVFVHVEAPGPLSRSWLAPAVAAVQAVLADELGALVQVNADDKGLVLLCVFGMPGSEVFRPDAPARAALRIADALGARGLRAGVGITSGRAYFGVVGAEGRAALGMSGSSLNLAARLMMLGDGVRCDDSVGIGADVTPTSTEAHSLKGFTRPVPVSLLTWGAPPDALRSTAPSSAVTAAHARRPRARGPVGREALLAEIPTATPGISAIVGDPGAGKSAVLAQVAARAPAGSARIAVATPALRDIPGAALARTLDLERLRVDAGDRAPLLGPAVGAAWDDTPATRDLRGFVRAHALVDLLVELLVPPADGGPLLVEDAQWLDEVSLLVLEQVGRRLPVIVTARASEGRLPERLAASWPTAAVRALPPLDASAVAALACAELGLDALPAGLLPWLTEHARGQPGFVLELLALVQDRGLLVIAEGAVRFFDATALDGLAPPATVEAVLAGRLDQLPAAAALALKVAAALGIDVDPDGWAAGCAAIGVGLADQLPVLERAGLVHRRPDGAGWRLDSALLQQVAHGQLVRDQRRVIHGALARWLEGTTAEVGSRRTTRLARHWGHAGEFERALAALEVAFADALRQGLPRSASRHAQAALRLDVEAGELGQPTLDPLSRARWHYRAASASRGFGDTDGAHSQLLLACAALGLALPADPAATRRALFGELLTHLWHAVVAPRRQEDPAIGARASVLAMLSLAHLLRGADPETLLCTALQAVTYARRSQGPVPASIAYSVVAIAFTQLPRVAERYLRAGSELAVALGDPLERMDAAIGRLLVDVAHCRWESVAAERERVLPLVRAGRAEHLRGVLLGLFAVADLMVGEMARARARADEMVEIGEQSGYLQARGWGLNIRITLALWGDAPADALANAREAREILDRRGEPDRLASRALEAVALVRLGRLDEAVAVVEELERLLDAEAVIGVTAFEACARPVEVWLAAHARGGGEDALARAGRALRRMEGLARRFPIAEPRALALRGAFLAARGRDGRASFTRAAEIARARGMATELALVLERLQPNGPELASLRARLRGGWGG